MLFGLSSRDAPSPGKRPNHAPLLRERTRSTPRHTQQPAQGAEAPGSSPRQPRAGNSTTQEDVRAGAAVPEGRSAQGGGAADGPRDPKSQGLQATGGFMLHPIRKASSRTPLLSSRATAASIKRRARQPRTGPCRADERLPKRAAALPRRLGSLTPEHGAAPKRVAPGE